MKSFLNDKLSGVSSVVMQKTNKLSPMMKKVAVVATVAVWLVSLLLITLLKQIPLAGGLVFAVWLIASVVVGKVVLDVWQSAKTPDASR